MLRLRPFVWAGVCGGLALLSGCASSDPCGERQGLFSRLGLRRSKPAGCGCPIVGTTVSSSPVVIGGHDFAPHGGGGPIMGPPAGVETHEGPFLPPAGTPPPFPLGTNGTPVPGSTTLPPPGAVIGPGDARPVPAAPSSRRVG